MFKYSIVIFLLILNSFGFGQILFDAQKFNPVESADTACFKGTVQHLSKYGLFNDWHVDVSKDITIQGADRRIGLVAFSTSNSDNSFMESKIAIPLILKNKWDDWELNFGFQPSYNRSYLDETYRNYGHNGTEFVVIDSVPWGYDYKWVNIDIGASLKYAGSNYWLKGSLFRANNRPSSYAYYIPAFQANGAYEVEPLLGVQMDGQWDISNRFQISGHYIYLLEHILQARIDYKISEKNNWRVFVGSGGYVHSVGVCSNAFELLLASTTSEWSNSHSFVRLTIRR